MNYPALDINTDAMSLLNTYEDATILLSLFRNISLSYILLLT